MGTINGTVYYNQSSYAGNTTGISPYIAATNTVKGLTVTIWDGQRGISVSTGNSGGYTVNNVPGGKTYYIVESFGTQATHSEIVNNFDTEAVVMDEPKALDPTVEFIQRLGFDTKNGTAIVSLTQNTYIYAAPSTDFSETCDFIDAPRIVVPLPIGNRITVGENLIVSVNSGSFGRYEAGTPAGTSGNAGANPYGPFAGSYGPDIYDSQLFDKYIAASATTPNDGYYTICNIDNFHTFNSIWFDTSGRIYGDETGRFLVVNGNGNGKYFFKEQVPVESGKDYIFSAWVMNMHRAYDSKPPEFTVEVLNDAGEALYREVITKDNPLEVTDIPTWKQVGKIISKDSIKDSEYVTVFFYDTGTAGRGNDFCVDEISFYELKESSPLPVAEKGIIEGTEILDKNEAEEEEVIEYIAKITNETASYIKNLIFLDDLPYGTDLASSTMHIKVDEIEFDASITKESLAEGINISGLLINLLNVVSLLRSNSNSYVDNPYYRDLREGRIPTGLTLEVTFNIVVNDASVLADDKLVLNTAIFKYTSPLDGLHEVPRISITNEVETKIFYPDVEASKYGPSDIISGQVYNYILKFENSGDGEANKIKIEDNIPEGFKIDSIEIENNGRDLTDGTDYTYTVSEAENKLTITGINDALNIEPNSSLMVTIKGHCDYDDIPVQ